MKAGQRVSLRSDASWQGVLAADPSGGVVEVRGDGGWRGRLPVGDLAPVEDKSWPPGNLETK